MLQEMTEVGAAKTKTEMGAAEMKTGEIGAVEKKTGAAKMKTGAAQTRAAERKTGEMHGSCETREKWMGEVRGKLLFRVCFIDR